MLLYAFSSAKNGNRTVQSINIYFEDSNHPFLTEDNVSKLLILNNDSVTEVPKDILDLNRLESTLNNNPLIKNAEVYMSVNGRLTAKIEQKTPIARVSTNASYYIDSSGNYMPLSSNYSARVPLLTGMIEKNNLESVFVVANKVYNDEMLKKHVVEIHQHNNMTYSLKLRKNNFKVYLGDIKNLDKKIGNFKAFYIKASKDRTLKAYRLVNLQFDNQVICTKT